MTEDLREQVEMYASHLLAFRKSKFVKRKITYYNTTVKSEEISLGFLVSVTVSSANIILGFHHTPNYNISEEPKLGECSHENVIISHVASVDKKEVNFILLDFTASYFLFADKLLNGIAYYKTNARREADTMITKGRWVFREEYRCVSN